MSASSCSFIQRGTASSIMAEQITRVSPMLTSTEPVAFGAKPDVKMTGRSWEGGRPSCRVMRGGYGAGIRLLLSSLLGFDPRRYRDNLDQSPAALNIVDFKDPVRAQLTLFNDTSHYESAGLAIPAVPAARLLKWWDEKAPR